MNHQNYEADGEFEFACKKDIHWSFNLCGGENNPYVYVVAVPGTISVVTQHFGMIEGTAMGDPESHGFSHVPLLYS